MVVRHPQISGRFRRLFCALSLSCICWLLSLLLFSSFSSLGSFPNILPPHLHHLHHLVGPSCVSVCTADDFFFLQPGGYLPVPQYMDSVYSHAVTLNPTQALGGRITNWTLRLCHQSSPHLGAHSPWRTSSNFPTTAFSPLYYLLMSPTPILTVGTTSCLCGPTLLSRTFTKYCKNLRPMGGTWSSSARDGEPCFQLFGGWRVNAIALWISRHIAGRVASCWRRDTGLHGHCSSATTPGVLLPYYHHPPSLPMHLL